MLNADKMLRAAASSIAADGLPEVGSSIDSACIRAAEVRQELQRVLASIHFEASDRNRRFLEYVVEETLAGRGGRIKAYNIATEVFGRDVDFDPQLDPVVRMEARRLRGSLERFYLTDGKSSSIMIALPKGCYVPEFRDPAQSASPDGTQKRNSSEPAGTERTSTILVTLFDAEGDQSIFQNFNRGLTEQIIVSLIPFPDISVFDLNAIQHCGSNADSEPRQIEANADFVLTGTTALSAGLLDVTAVLVQRNTGRVLWGQSFAKELKRGNILTVRDEVANSIARAIAQPYGVIYRQKAKAIHAKEPRLFSPLECITRFYEYRHSYRRDLFLTARECLEQTVSKNPDYAEAFACLSLLSTDGQRFGFASAEPPRPRQQAADLARTAIELAPDSGRGHHALGLAHWFTQDIPASLKALRTALSLNPNDTEVLTDLGLIWSLLGEWGRGVPLLEEASTREPSGPGVSHVGLSLYHFMNGRYEDALAEAFEIDAPDVTYGFVVQAISLVRLGRKGEAVQAVKRIIDLTPFQSRGVLADIAGVNANAELTKTVLAALRDAGLPTKFTRH